MDIGCGLMILNTPRSAFFFAQIFFTIAKEIGKKYILSQDSMFFFF
jgi:hypothetical protein